MKTYQYYLDEVSKEAGYLSFSPSFMINSEIEKLAREAAHRYTKQCIKEHLSRAAENAKAIEVDKDYNFQPGYYPIHAVDRESITNIDIQLP